MADATKKGVDAAKVSDPAADAGHEAHKITETHKNIGEHEAKSLVETVREKAAEAYNYVAGGEGDKGLVGTVREKAAEAYNYVAEKVSEATHAVTGDSHKDTGKDKAPEKAS